MKTIIDIHSHILPGVDDGARNWDMCKSMLLKSAEAGVTSLIATPHYLPWRQKVSSSEICKLCEQIQQKFQKETGIIIDIYSGNEIYYHVDIIDSLREKKALTLADSRYVLLEFSTEESYSVICNAVHNLRIAGYIPIIAHVERYSSMRQLDRLDEVHNMGALFQVNVEVLGAGLFDKTGRFAKKALLEEEIHFLSSDMHNLTSRPPLNETDFIWIQRKLSADYQKDILYNNGMKILS